MLAAILATAGCGGKSDAVVIAEGKRVIKGSCIRQGTGSKLIPGDKLDAFCECSAQRVVTDLGAEGLRAVASNEQATVDPAKLKAASTTCYKQIVGG
jgi:hypothetical protein